MCHMVHALAMQALDKIKTTVESGSYYEAQQMYKTVYHRYRNKRQLKDSYQILQVQNAPYSAL